MPNSISCNRPLKQTPLDSPLLGISPRRTQSPSFHLHERFHLQERYLPRRTSLPLKQSPAPLPIPLIRTPRSPRHSASLVLAAFLLAVVVSLITPSPALAQASLPQPVDPLKRPEHTPGRLTLNLSLGYAPTSGLVLDYDADGNPYSDTYASHTLSPSISLSYALSDRLTLGGGLTVHYQIEQTLRRYSSTDTRYLQTGSLAIAPRASLAYRLSPESSYDPSLSFTLYKPWAVGSSLSASLLRDPIVLSSSLSFSHSFMPPYASSFALAFGSGFVANDRISFSLDASLSQPLNFAAAPSLSLDFSSSYGLDPEGDSQLSLDLAASLRGSTTNYSLSFSYSRREIDLASLLTSAKPNTKSRQQ